uniref:DUF4220 domain-containing protein n=1 Tax=Leersia perrieri TaxID=77586 RepID=A0A0D9XHR8_9ORYZ
MSLSSAVQWWEEWQLRILVLGSVGVQLLLLISAYTRKLSIPFWVRTLIWLAYLGSDATAIYALATLFNRHRTQDCSCAQSSSALEVVWAPILLMHLGGLDIITAYDIEDNELWKRHIITAVSQITVSIYVFCKSWPPGGDKRLRQAAILLFVPGILKCIEKPWALKSASINSLVSYRGTVLRTRRTEGEGDGVSLESYVQQAREIVSQTDTNHPAVIMPFAALGLFHNSHREEYNGHDIKVTYTLLCCTAVVELYSFSHQQLTTSIWSCQFSRRNLLQSYAGRSMKPSISSSSITELVLQHVKQGWKDYITNIASYWAFNDHRGQWALQRNNCDRGDLAWSVRLPFDESVLLWHLATDFCLACTEPIHEGGIHITEISNYMMYLLYDNPEMLMAGTRRNLFTTAIAELKDILREEQFEDQELAGMIIAKVESTTEGRPGFIRDACALSKVLLSLGDEKMWEVIKGVWVEMLCFCASRCRGYLHAKSLGAGGELLTFVWLLLLHMGMEPLAERLQRADLPRGGGNGATDAAPMSSDETLAESQQNTEVPSGEGNNDTDALLSSDQTMAERQQNTEVSSGEVNIGDVPSTCQDRIAINIKEENTF